MKNTTFEFVSEYALKTLSKANKEERYDDTIREGLQLYLTIYPDNEPAKNTIPLVYVQTAIEKLLLKISDSKQAIKPNEFSCSFCGRSPPNVRLGAGPDAFICNECVSTFSDIFAEKE